MFRNGILSIMNQTLDPLTEGEGTESGDPGQWFQLLLLA